MTGKVMTPHNLRIYALIQAQVAEMESMRVTNLIDQINGETPTFSSSCFLDISINITELSNQIEDPDKIILKTAL